MKHTKHIVAVALLVSSLVTIIVLYRAGHPFREYLVTNADLLYLPTLFSDLLAQGGRLSDWFLTPAPYFFPDYPVYFISYVLGSGTYSRIGLFAVAQTILTFFAIWLLARGVARAEALILAVTITIGLTWFALTAGEPFVILLASASHYGSFISALILSALWIHYHTPGVRPGRGVLLSAICILAFVSALSDNFFLVQAVVPFVAATILVTLADGDASSPPRRAPLIAAWALLALVVPALTYSMPVPTPVVNVRWSSTVDEQQRTSLETMFHLADGDFRGGRTWTYHMTDTTRTNAAALVSHRSVEDTAHIDRESFVVEGVTSPLRLAVSTLPIGLGVSTFLVLCWVCVRRMWIDLRQRLSITTPLLAVVSAVFAALGSISYPLFVAHRTRYAAEIGLEKAHTNLMSLSAAIQDAITKNPAYGIVFAGYLGLTAFVLYDRFWKSTNRRSPSPLAWLVVFSALSLCSTLTAASLLTDLPVASRYLIPAFSWPVVIVALFLGHSLGRRVFGLAAAVSLLAVGVLSANAYALAQSNGVSERFYPSDISCIDDVLEKEGLSNGIAQYWDAKYVQQFSRLNLRIAQYLENLDEMKWITSESYYRSRYDFAIVAEDAEPPYKISSDALSKINGSPKQVVSCGSRSVYVYGRDQLSTRTR